MKEMEFTNEMIHDAENCKHFETCHECAMPYSQIHTCIENLSRALQAERAKPKVWDGAPDDACKAFVYWGFNKRETVDSGPEYTRTLPKTRADEIAEETWQEFGDPETKEDFLRFCKSAILKREAELKEAGE